MLKRGALIYGAIAETNNVPARTLLEQFKRKLKIIRDVLRTRFAGRLKVDYLDYEVPYPSNIGDAAIAEAARNHFFEQTSGLFLNVNWDELDTVQSSQAIDPLRMLVVAGSGYFLFSAKGELPKRLWRDLAFFEHSKLPLVLYGVGVNKLYDPMAGLQAWNMSAENEDLLRRMLARADLISVRDQISLDVLQKYTDKPVVLSGDPALFLYRGASRDMPRRVDGANRVPQVGINFPLHGILVEAQLKQNFLQYIELLKQFQTATHCQFHYFVHSEMEAPVPALLRSYGLTMHVVAGDAYALSAEYAKLDMHLAGMLHSCILASGVGTPCVALAYDSKHQSFFDLLGMTEFCHSASELNMPQVLASMLQLLQNAAVWRSRIEQRKSELSRVFVGLIEECRHLSP